MLKSEVYSWRIARDLKSAIEDAARREGISASELLERAVRSWLDEREKDSDDQEQRVLHAKVREVIGSIAGGPRSRRAERVRELVSAKLKAKAASRRGP